MGASTMEVVSADGFRIPVTEEGHGRPILIVHGGGGPSASWARVAGHLATRFRVLRFDRRTYRRPGGAEPTATMENEVNDVLAVAAAAGEQVVLVGHSSGAVVALEAALASPVPFAGMVLYPPRAHGQHVDSRQGRAHHRGLRRPGAALRKRKPPNYS